ncbi:A/G-specific adenine glycosylase [Mesohalobacter halotolerans]|uniref:Adenine DNA glycosylase n=1 Tax=Mesohalobacter halotolerans TaxID=1883405 RepID=A0A4U5TSR1_9FLAO|nr:A/G-specific adenine glycosylase [Mesohalobacter halotolerans]
MSLSQLLSDEIKIWYKNNKRDLPWRNTKNPYKIWLSEIILQQTQVKQGLPYYNKFLKAYADVHKLANAEEDEILKMWQGLGYYSRARNLHFTAKYISKECKGKFPKTYKELLKLKGVGEYTAAAIASFAYDEPVAVLDGNVYRVLSRYFGIDTPVNSTEGAKIFKSKAYEILDENKPALHNQAMMEYGALLCKPKSPDCMFCSLNPSCVAFQQNKTKSLPVKLKKLKRKKRFFNYIIFQSSDKEMLIKQRLGKDIWQKLYEFPLLETQKPANPRTVFDHELFKKLNLPTQIKPTKINSKTNKHVLTHQDIYADFWLIECSIDFKKFNLKDYEVVNYKSIRKFAVSILIDKFLNNHILED